MDEHAGLVTYRPLTPDDEPFLWKMLYQAVYVQPGAPPPDPHIIDLPDLARYVAGWGRDGDLGTAAIDAGQPVGAAWLRLMMGYGYVDDRTPELSTAVLPSHRGWGIGTRMIARVLESARVKYPAVSLSVTMGNPAQRLYERLGFEVIKQDSGALTMKINLACFT
jgi:ribosomal protein S18 acetylase RimI-like enzyme